MCVCSYWVPRWNEILYYVRKFSHSISSGIGGKDSRWILLVFCLSIFSAFWGFFWGGGGLGGAVWWIRSNFLALSEFAFDSIESMKIFACCSVSLDFWDWVSSCKCACDLCVHVCVHMLLQLGYLTECCDLLGWLPCFEHFLPCYFLIYVLWKWKWRVCLEHGSNIRPSGCSFQPSMILSIAEYQWLKCCFCISVQWIKYLNIRLWTDSVRRDSSLHSIYSIWKSVESDINIFVCVAVLVCNDFQN